MYLASMSVQLGASIAPAVQPVVRKAVIYLRLSVTGDEDSTSIAKMRKDCIDWCEREGVEWSEDRILIDDGISGGLRRAKADKALAWLREGVADIVVTWKYDRWSRQGIQSVGELMETLLKTKPRTRFVGLMDGMDSDHQFFPMLAGMIAELARIERENTRMRVRSTQELLATMGRYKGGEQLYGYAPEKLDGGGYRQGPDDVQWPILREIVERIIAGEKAAAIATNLNERVEQKRVEAALIKDETARKFHIALIDRMTPRSGRFHANTIRRFLVNPLLRGQHVYRVDWKKWPFEFNVQLDAETHLPIRPHAAVVTDEEWDQLQAALRTGTRRAIQNRDGHMLLGLAFCGHCGTPMSRKDEAARGTQALVCSRRNHDIPCGGNRIVRSYVEKVVEDEFLMMFGDLPVMEHIEVEEDTTRVREITEALEVVGRRMRDAKTRDEEREWSDRKWELMAELEHLESTITGQTKIVRRETGTTYAEEWTNADDNTKRAYLAELGCRVQVSPSGRRKGLNTRGYEYAAARITVDWLDDAMEDAA